MTQQDPLHIEEMCDLLSRRREEIHVARADAYEHLRNTLLCWLEDVLELLYPEDAHPTIRRLPTKVSDALRSYVSLVHNSGAIDERCHVVESFQFFDYYEEIDDLTASG